MSTLPKSVQTAHGPNASMRDKRQACKELIDKYRRLPDDFLRVPSSYYPANQTNDSALAMTALGIADSNIAPGGGPLVEMIDISVVEAQLVKNYGLLRMDLYCKIRVGHMVCETQICPNGAKNPKWQDGVYQFSLKPGIDSFHLEIYDKKQFSLDEKIAWLHEPMPREIFNGITVERWFPLSGRSGPHKEGSVLLVISHKRVPMRASNFGRSIMSHHQIPHGIGPVFMAGPNQHHIIGRTPPIVSVDPSVPISTPPLHAQTNLDAQQHTPDTGAINQSREAVAQVRPASEEDINQLSEMFPSIDKQIIKAILENNHHDKEASIGALLAMG